MRATIVLTVVFLAGLLLGTTLNAEGPSAKANVKTLMEMPLAKDFTPDREVLVDLVEIPPNTALERHWHPGEEFHYYMEGEVEIKIDGEPSIMGTPGTVGHVPYKKWHTAVAGKDGVKLLVFRVHTAGEPWRYLEEAGSKDQQGTDVIRSR